MTERSGLPSKPRENMTPIEVPGPMKHVIPPISAEDRDELRQKAGNNNGSLNTAMETTSGGSAYIQPHIVDAGVKRSTDIYPHRKS